MTPDVSLWAGLALLLCPAEALLGRQVEAREFESFRTLENSPRHQPWWWVPALWFDPLRGAMGAWLASMGLGISALGRTVSNVPEYWIFVGVLALATTLQTLAKNRREAMLAPIGFLAGVVFALVPWAVAGLGVTIALVGMFALGRFAAFFIGGGIGILALGLAFKASLVFLLPTVGIFALPVLLAVTTGRPLELPTLASPSRKSAPRPG